ncbi:MAG: hypothetical protein ACKVPJ_13495 [Chitinophagales bacterium]
MTLISFNDVIISEQENEKINYPVEVARFKKNTRALLIKNRVTLADSIGIITKSEDIFFLNIGRWSAHDLQFYILEQTGPAEVYLTTWAISELSSRLIHQGLQDGLITKLHCILDRRIEIRNDSNIALLRHSASRICFVDWHAKIMVIRNANWNIAIMGTANHSNNLRAESGHIYTDGPVSNYLVEIFEKVFADNKLFLWS